MKKLKEILIAVAVIAVVVICVAMLVADVVVDIKEWLHWLFL
ncbi:MAG: hypothetical protein PHD43_23130 [Methylococcales bacterium]|nr:hypothetical protein [Methylococcales bacterium]